VAQGWLPAVTETVPPGPMTFPVQLLPESVKDMQ
jgi:hypothetical protein